MKTKIQITKKLGILVTLMGLAQIAKAEGVQPPPHIQPLPIATFYATHRIRATNLASGLEQSLRTMKLRLHNNNNSQQSYVEVGGFHVPFSIPRVVVDIDCGFFCPDLGDAYFYLNDVNLMRANFDWLGNRFMLGLTFEDGGREIKGYHNKFGDGWVPDFNLKGIKLDLNALPKVVNGRLSLGFYQPNLIAQIDSTGGCHVAGIDLCNRIFGSDRKIQKAVESSALSALNGGLVQTAIQAGLQQYLRSIGIERTVVRVQVEGQDVVITTL